MKDANTVNFNAGVHLGIDLSRLSFAILRGSQLSYIIKMKKEMGFNYQTIIRAAINL